MGFCEKRLANYRQHVSRTPHGWVNPYPRQTKRKRFGAYFEKGWNIHHKLFPTRKAALDWLQFLEARYDH